MKQYVITYRISATGVVHVNARNEVHARRFVDYRFNPNFHMLTDAEICESSEEDGEGKLVGRMAGHEIASWNLVQVTVEPVPPGEEEDGWEYKESGGFDGKRLLPAERDVTDLAPPSVPAQTAKKPTG